MFLGLGLGLAKQAPGTVFADAKTLQDWHSSNAVSLSLTNLHRASYREDKAQVIRDAAGVPAGIEIGIQTGVMPGYSGSLSAQSSPYNINSESDAQNIAASGTGTQADPYIIELLEFDGAGSAVRGLNFNDGAADYYVTVRNCLFHDFTAEGLKVNAWGTTLVSVENCTFYNTTGTGALIRRVTGNLSLSAVLFSGCDDFGAYIDNTSTGTHTVTMRNIKVTDDDGTWAANNDVFQLKAVNTTFDIRYVEIEDGMSGQESIFQLMGCASDTYIAHVKYSGGWFHFLTDNDDSAVSKGFTLEYFDLVDTTREHIHMQNVNGATIRYGSAAHNTGGTNYRVFFFESDSADDTIRVQNIDIDFVKFTKNSGTQIATNEVCESWYGENIRFRNSWITAGPEDGFEHVYSLGGCTVEYCVGDNLAGQVVDFFKKGELSGGGFAIVTDTSTLNSGATDYVHHIYGDTTNDHGVILSGTAWVFGHDIYVDTSAAPSNKGVLFIQDRDGVVARNIQFAGPFTQGDDRSGRAVLLEGGDDIAYNYIEDGALKSFEPLDLLNVSVSFWLDSADASTITHAANAVAQWDDKSGNGRDVSQAIGSSQPRTNTRSLNGLNVIDFDGGDYMDRNDALGLVGNPNFTAFIVAKFDASVATNDRLLQVGDDIDPMAGQSIAITGGANGYSYRFNDGNKVFGLVDTASPAITIWERASGDDYEAGKLWLNGGAEEAQTSAGSPTNTPNLTNNRTLVGTGLALNADLNGFMDGYIAEIIVYNAVLSAAEKTTIGAYLADKWGLTMADIT